MPPPPPVGEAINRGLVDCLVELYQTSDLAHVDPFSAFTGYLKAPPRARTCTRTVPMTFEGSAAGFQKMVEGGFPVRMTVRQALGDTAKTLENLRPYASKNLDGPQELTRFSFDMDAVLINSVMLAEPLNTTTQSVGIRTSTLPFVYAEMKAKQSEDLAFELGVDPLHPDVVAHIPVGETPDMRQIPVLKEVVNGFHSSEVCKTFGGITAQHLGNGFFTLEPDRAAALGLGEPRPLPPPPDDSMPQAHNSWVIVPVGHILSHVANLPVATVRDCGFEVYQLRMPATDDVIPFLLMDMLTVMKYIGSTTKSALINVDRNRTSILDQWIELIPLTNASWLGGCVAGQEYKTGIVSFKLIISYTVFPAGFRQDPRLLPLLSDGFPKLDTEFRSMVDSDEIAKSVAPRSKRALRTAHQEGAAAEAAEATQQMDEGSDADDADLDFGGDDRDAGDDGNLDDASD